MVARTPSALPVPLKRRKPPLYFFERESRLEALGVDVAAGSIPDGLTVVQVGDLVHKGPDGDAAVALADRMMNASPLRWVQLIGNHEAQHVDGPGFGDCDCSEATADTIRRWVRTGQAQLATAVDDVDDGPLLVTHAGLTRQAWSDLDSPSNPVTAADRLNNQLHTDRSTAFAAGVMLAGQPGRRPGVVWASASDELYPSWIGHRSPFGQVHGHTSAYWWGNERWVRSTPTYVLAEADVDHQRRHLRVEIGRHPFYGIDPSFAAADPNYPISPLLLSSA
jgi:hypothetical protein